MLLIPICLFDYHCQVARTLGGIEVGEPKRPRCYGGLIHDIAILEYRHLRIGVRHTGYLRGRTVLTVG